MRTLHRGTMDIPVVEMGEREFKLFRLLVHRLSGIWLRDGKQVMLAARLSRRLRHHGMTSFADYYEYVQVQPSDSSELRELINCVTTNKTSFFRERHHFDYLAGTIVPQIRVGTRPGLSPSIRVWSAACSTGEEAYSIAITLLESWPQARISGPPEIEIAASDIDTSVLDIAQRGIYREDSLSSIDKNCLKKYFLRGNSDMRGLVKVKPEVARLIDFQQINLMSGFWPLGGRFDVVFFRNALIYFQRETQDVFLRRIARLLNPGGYLFLGNAEHIPWLTDIFVPLHHTMYRLRENCR